MPTASLSFELQKRLSLLPVYRVLTLLYWMKREKHFQITEIDERAKMFRELRGFATFAVLIAGESDVWKPSSRI
jgi:hypothetical protein